MIKEFSCPFAVFLLGQIINFDFEENKPIKEYKKPIFIHPDFELTFKMRYNLENYSYGCLDYTNKEEEHPFDGQSYMKRFRTDVVWDMGDGNKINSSSLKYKFDKPGKYKISCILFDIDKNAYANEYSFTVIVKEFISTKVSYYNLQEVKHSVVACEPTLISTLECNLSSLVSNEPDIIADRIIQKDEEESISYFDLEESQMNHLKTYWCFLEKRYERGYDSNTVLHSKLFPVQKYSVDFEKIYCSFYREGEKIKVKTYVIYPWSKGYKEHPLYFLDPNKDIFDEENYCKLKENEDGYWDCHSMPIILSHESELPFNVFECGKRGFVDVYYKDDEIGKKTVSFHYDMENLKLKNAGYENENYLNVIPIGHSFELYSSNSNMVLGLTSNGILHGSLGNKNAVIDETYSNYLSVDMNYPIIISFFRKYVLDGEENYYIVKTFENTLHNANFRNVSGVVNKENNDFYIKGEINPNVNSRIYVTFKNSTYVFDIANPKNYNTLVIPTEKLHEENVERLLKVMMPHVLFDDANNLKDAFRAVFSHKNSLNKIITRIKNFVDDHSNNSKNYINQLLNFLNLMGSSVKEYGVANFDGVNAMRDFARIVSMNHNDLVGQIRLANPDISVDAISTGLNVGDEILIDDVLTINEKGYITHIERDGKRMKVDVDGGVPLIVCERNSFITNIVDFYMGIETIKEDKFFSPEIVDENNKNVVSEQNYIMLLESYIEREEDYVKVNRTSISRYNKSWGWNLLLPSYNPDNIFDMINGYYSFYLYRPVEHYIREYNFLSEVTKEINDEWEKEYGITFDCFNKIILESFGALNKTE